MHIALLLLPCMCTDTVMQVRFNDVGETALLSISQIFRAWPQTAAALQALDDVEALASDLSNYNFSGVDKYVQPAVAAGRNLNWRIGVCALIQTCA